MNWKNFNLKTLAPYVIGIFAFILVTLVYFNPLLEGKKLKQADIQHHEGMSKEVSDYYASHNGEQTLWTNSMFGGMPAYQISVQHKSNLVQYIDRYIFNSFMPNPSNFVFLTMLGCFFLLLVLGVNPWLSIVGAIAFSFSSYFFIILEAGHNSKAHAIAYMAPVLASIILTFKKKYLLGGSLTALFLALELFAGHPQISYYLGLIVVILGIAEFIRSIRNKELLSFAKAAAVLIVAAIIAVGTSASNYMTTAEYSPTTIRGASELTIDHKSNQTSGLDKDYATQWSYGIGETWSLMIPNAKGGASDYLGNNADIMAKMSSSQYAQYLSQSPSYWGDQPFTSGPVYIGAIIIFLFIFGLFIVKGELKWVLLIATLLSIMLSWGKNMMWFTDFFFSYLPAYNKFRAVSMTLVMAELTIVILAFLALKEVFNKPELLKEKRKEFFIAFGLTGGLSLLFYFMPTMFFNFLSQEEAKQLPQMALQNPAYKELFGEIEIARQMIFKSDALRSFGFILVAGIAIFLYGLKKLPKEAFIAIIGVLIIVDLWMVDRRYLNNESFDTSTVASAPYEPTAADMQILNDKSLDYRVINATVSTFNDASTSYFHKSIGGYHGAKLRRYQDIIDYHLAFNNMEVLNMLNTKYFITPDQNQQPYAQVNPMACGNAWFVNEINWVNNPDQELMHIGKMIEIKNLKPNENITVFGRPINAVDTIMLTSNIVIKGIGPGAEDETINLGSYQIGENQTYIIGSNAQDTTAGYIALSKLKNPASIDARQFEVRIIYTFNPLKQAVIDKKFESTLKGFQASIDSNARIIMQSYQPNHLVYATNTTKDQLAVFSEIYYEKGWNAYIDGVKSDYVRANYILRAMKVPAGVHKIEFKFEPETYAFGSKLSLISSILLFLAMGAGLFFTFRTKGKSEIAV